MANPAKESKTTESLIKTYLGESAARNRYTYFAKAAKKEGFEQISAIFLETAENELEHAKIFFKYLGEKYGLIETTAEYPVGLSKTTEENLQFAALGEHDENSILYPNFRKIAKEEGYDEIAERYEEVIEVEKVHEKRFLDLLDNVKQDKVFKKDNEVIWKCRKCGYHYKGESAPDFCPSCKHPFSYFELFVKNY